MYTTGKEIKLNLETEVPSKIFKWQNDSILADSIVSVSIAHQNDDWEPSSSRVELRSKQKNNKNPVIEDHTGNDTINKDEFVVNKIVRNAFEDKQILYRVCWYEFTKEDCCRAKGEHIQALYMKILKELQVSPRN